MKLQQLQIFQNLTEEELEKSLVCSQAVVKKYPKDTYIFRQGDVPLKLYFILEGMVELGSINLNGKITRSSYVTVGEEFGEVEMFLRQSAYSGYAKAKNEVSVLEVSQNFFGGRCERNCVHHSKVVFNMLQLFAEKAEKCNRQIEVLTSGNLRQRVAAYLLENCNPDYRVRLHMNREDLAVYLNTTRPSLSRMLLTLQDEGIIRLVGRKVIEITDYERLLAYLQKKNPAAILLFLIRRLDIPSHLEDLQRLCPVRFRYPGLLQLGHIRSHMVHIHIFS